MYMLLELTSDNAQRLHSLIVQLYPRIVSHLNFNNPTTSKSEYSTNQKKNIHRSCYVLCLLGGFPTTSPSLASTIIHYTPA